MKRTHHSLAVSAVGALAVTGLGLVPAPAHAAGLDLHLLSLTTGTASTALDGTDNAVRLTAQSSDLLGSITFQYNTDPAAAQGAAGWTDIAGSGTENGPYYYLDWTPDASLDGTSLAVRAKIVDGGETAYTVRHDVALTSTVPPDSVFVTNGSSTGFFVQPYADSKRTRTETIATGTGSATTGTADLSWRGPSDTTFRGHVDAQISTTFFKPPGGSFVLGGTYAGVLDITAFGAEDGDVLALRAEDGTEDVTPTSLYAQTITAISAGAVGEARTDRTGDVDVTVTDQDGVPVAGAEVRRTSDKALMGYTDAHGVVVAQQQGGTTESYYANTTDVDRFQSGVDVKSSDVMEPTYDGTATTAQGSSLDGPVFDRDENALGDVAVVVYDQQGVTFGAGYDVQYKIYPTGGDVPMWYATATTDADGRAAVPLPDDATGEYTVEYLDPSGTSQTFTVTTGDATLELRPHAKPDVAASGGSIAYTGRLVLPGGVPLPGRAIAVTYRRGIELVPGTGGADAGIVAGSKRVTSATATTGTDGRFTFTVADDAAKPRSSEVGGQLGVATAKNVATDTSTLSGNAGEQASTTTRFGSGALRRAAIHLTGKAHGARADELAVRGGRTLAGERVSLYRVVGKRLSLVRTVRLRASGTASGITVKDGNGAKRTTYVAKVVASKRVKASTSHRVTLE